MSRAENKTIKTVIISGLIGISVTIAFVFLFAAVMYFGGMDKTYSVIFATISVAAGCLAAAFVAAYKNRKKGFLIGLVVGGIAFSVIFLISLISDKGAITVNTLFHLIIFMLSSVIGGVMGVNKSNDKKYIK